MENDEGSLSTANKVIYSFIGLFVVAGLAYFLFFYYGGSNGFSRDSLIEPVSVQTPFAELNSSQQLEIMKASESFRFPGIQTQLDVASTSLPTEVQDLFGGMDGDLNFSSLVFIDGSVGYGARLVSSGSVEDLYMLLHKNSKTSWPPVRGSRTDKAAFLNMELELYAISADFSNMGGLTEVSIIIIEK